MAYIEMAYIESLEKGRYKTPEEEKEAFALSFPISSSLLAK